MLSTLQREIAHLEGGGKQTPLSYKSSFAFFPNEARQHHVKNTFLHRPVEYREVRYDFAGIIINNNRPSPPLFITMLLSIGSYHLLEN